MREVLHWIATFASAIALGQIALPDELFGANKSLIVSIAGAIGAIITLYLTRTTTGLAKSELPASLQK